MSAQLTLASSFTSLSKPLFAPKRAAVTTSTSVPSTRPSRLTSARGSVGVGVAPGVLVFVWVALGGDEGVRVAVGEDVGEGLGVGVLLGLGVCVAVRVGLLGVRVGRAVDVALGVRVGVNNAPGKAKWPIHVPQRSAGASAYSPINHRLLSSGSTLAPL
jgi:hypothetical protein